MTEPTVGATVPTVLQEDWREYGSQFVKSWEAILQLCERDDTKIVAAHGGDCCFIPVPHASYNLEWSPDGYARLRYLKSKGEGKRQKYMRNGKEAERTVYPKGSLYIHHLAFVMRNPQSPDIHIPRRAVFASTSGSMSSDVWLTLSHLCGRNACVNPDHIILEPHALNLSRNACSAEVCSHSVKCRKAQSVHAKVVKTLEEKFFKIVQ